jgi:hypothetical protein
MLEIDQLYKNTEDAVDILHVNKKKKIFRHTQAITFMTACKYVLNDACGYVYKYNLIFGAVVAHRNCIA